MNTDYHAKKIVSSFALFAVLGGLIALPIISFGAFKSPIQNNDQVLGISKANVSAIDGKIKYTESKKKMISFEIILEPNEFYVKNIEGAVGTSQIALTEGEQDSYATNTNGTIELINLSDNTLLVKGVVF